MLCPRAAPAFYTFFASQRLDAPRFGVAPDARDLDVDHAAASEFDRTPRVVLRVKM